MASREADSSHARTHARERGGEERECRSGDVQEESVCWKGRGAMLHLVVRRDAVRQPKPACPLRRTHSDRLAQDPNPSLMGHVHAIR